MKKFDAFANVDEVYQRLITAGKLDMVLKGLKQNERTAVLIDANNLICALEAQGVRIDYGRLKDLFSTRCDLVTMNMFIATSEGRVDQKKWLDILQDEYGYRVISKNIRTYDDFGQKGNMDVEITISAMKLMSSVEHVVLITGDRDFIPLVSELRNNGRRVSVVGSLQGSVKYTSRDLTNAANHFFDLKDLLPYITSPAYGEPANTDTVKEAVCR